MDMLKVLKIRSVENAEYSTQYNRMRFKIPADNLNTHLNESYLSFQVVPTDSTTNQPVASSVNVGFGNADKAYYPTCLLKTVRLFRGDSNIPLEEIQNFNILDQTMKLYEKDIENLVSDQYESGFYVADNNQGFWSSTYLNGGNIDVHLYLKDIFGLCKNKDFYLSDTAGLQIEFELEDRYKLFDTLPPNDPEGIANLPSTVIPSTSTITIDPTLRTAFYPASGVSQQSFASNNGQTVIARPAENSTGNKAQKGRGLGGGGKASKTKTPIKQDNFFFRLDDTVAPVFGTYVTATKSFPVTVAVASTPSAIPKFQGNNNKLAGLQCVSSVAESTQYINQTLQELSDITLYYKTSTGQVGMTQVPVVSLSATAFVAPSTQATFILNIQLDSSTAPTNWIVYAVGFPESPSSRTTSSGHIEVNSAVASGSMPAGVPTNLYCINSLKQMDLYATNMNYTPASGSNPATYQFTSLDSNFVVGNTYLLEYNVIGAYFTSYLSAPAISSGVLNRLIEKRTEVRTRFKATAVDTLILIDDEGESLNYNVYEDDSVISVSEEDLYGSSGSGGLVFASLTFKDLDIENQSTQLGAVVPANITYKIPRAELVLIQGAKSSSDEPAKVYSTWKVEPALIDYETSRWQRQFILEPNVYNACLLTPESVSSGSEPLFSELFKIGSYRWSLDNIDNTNRDVPSNKGLHNDKLIDWFNNSPMKLKSLVNYGEESLGFVPMKIYTAMDDENMYMDNKSHTLQIVLNSEKTPEGTEVAKIPSKNVYLFKEVLKTL